MQTDYLADARLGDVPFMKLKRFLLSAGVAKAEVGNVTTKFALVALAEKQSILLEPLLAECASGPTVIATAAPPANTTTKSDLVRSEAPRDQAT